MGCWNKTCGLSQLPIYAGTPTVNFLIIENVPYGDERETPNHPCYSDTYWSLVPLPIYGKYNDYGWQEDDAGEEWKYSLLNAHYKDVISMSLSGVKNAASEYKRYNDAGEKPFTNSENLGNAIHGNLIHIAQMGKKSVISSMMVDRDLFEELTARISSGPRYGKDEISLTKDELVVFAENAINHIKTVTATADDEEPGMGFIRMEMLSLDYNSDTTLEALGIDKDDSYYHPAYWFWLWLAAGLSSHGFETRNFVKRQRMNVPAKELVDAFLFNHVMDSLRRQFIPMGHEGSQGGIGDIHTQFATAYMNRVNAIKAEWDEDKEFEDE